MQELTLFQRSFGHFAEESTFTGYNIILPTEQWPG